MNTFKIDFDDIANLPVDLRNKTVRAAKFAARSAFYREARRARKVYRMQLTTGTNMPKAMRNRRFLYKTWTKKDRPLHGMNARVEVGDFPELMQWFTQGKPKFVKAKDTVKWGKVQYYRPNFSPLGNMMIKPDDRLFQTYRWKRNPKQRRRAPRTRSKTKGAFSRRVYKRANPNSDSSKIDTNKYGNKGELTGSIYELFTVHTSIASLGFNAVRANLPKTFRNTLDKKLDGTIKGRPKKNAKAGR